MERRVYNKFDKIFFSKEVVFCDSSKQLREMIWKTLISLVTQPLYQKHMIEIFYSYDLRYKFESTKNESEFAHFDFEGVTEIS